MDDLYFLAANMTCPPVELGSFNPIFTYFYQLERQICKIEAANSRVEVSNAIAAIHCTPFENAQRWTGKNTFHFLLLNDDNMITLGDKS